ncbi:hypothetical protein K413DRAFT_4732 [Clostridium sp. ASBs410]|nr:hypothetical protein K413DRAFT_4732 [Clostridium sp. ASBs410]
MATVGKTKEDIVRESMNSPKEIDTSVEFKIPRSPQLYDPEKHKYKCSCCGRGYTTQNGNFQKTNDVLFQANDGYLPWCKDCTDAYVVQTTALFSNNEELAMKDFCQRAGWNYDLTALVASRETYSGHRNRSRISHYAAKKNLNCEGRKTYIDSLKFNYNNRSVDTINSIEDVKESKTVKLKTVKFFGAGFPDDDYPYLQEQYDDWTSRCECKTKAQEEVFKRICFKQLEILKANRAGKDTKDLDKTFQDYLDTANLKPKQNNLDVLSDAQTFGTLLAKWETERPLPDIDEELQDIDKIGLYIDVFFRGHLAKMMGLKNGLSNLYSKFIKEYTVERPEYQGDEDNEALFDAIFGSKNDE